MAPCLKRKAVFPPHPRPFDAGDTLVLSDTFRGGSEQLVFHF